MIYIDSFTQGKNIEMPFFEKDSNIVKFFTDAGTQAELSSQKIEKFVNELSDIKKTDDETQSSLKRQYILNSNVSGTAKCLALSSTLSSDKDMVLLEGLLSSGSDPNEVAKTMIAIKDADSAKKNKGSLMRQAIMDSDLSDSDKMALYIAKVSDAKTDEIKDCLELGISMDEYLKFDFETYGLTSNSSESKKDQVVGVINSYNLSKDQKDALFLVNYKASGLKDTPWNQSASKQMKLPTMQLPKMGEALEPLYLPKY